MIQYAAHEPDVLRRIPVSVAHKGDDLAGKQLAFALKEAVRGSRSFRFVNEEGAPATPRIDVHLLSVASDLDRVTTAIAYTSAYDHASIPASGILLNAGVNVCGRDRIESCAKGILPGIDWAVEYLRKDWPDLWRTLITGSARYSEQQTPDAFCPVSDSTYSEVRNIPR